MNSASVRRTTASDRSPPGCWSSRIAPMSAVSTSGHDDQGRPTSPASSTLHAQADYRSLAHCTLRPPPGALGERRAHTRRRGRLFCGARAGLGGLSWPTTWGSGSPPHRHELESGGSSLCDPRRPRAPSESSPPASATSRFTLCGAPRPRHGDGHGPLRYGPAAPERRFRVSFRAYGCEP